MESLRGSRVAATAAQVTAAHRVAAAIEAAEGRFAAAAGDLAFNAVQRTDFDVGRLLAAVKARREEYDEVAEHWTRDGRHGAPLPQVRCSFSMSARGQVSAAQELTLCSLPVKACGRRFFKVPCRSRRMSQSFLALGMVQSVALAVSCPSKCAAHAEVVHTPWMSISCRSPLTANSTRVHTVTARSQQQALRRVYPSGTIPLLATVTATLASLTQRVAGLRLLLACLMAWGADAHPLTDDDCVSRLKRWAAVEDAATKPPPVRSATRFSWAHRHSC